MIAHQVKIQGRGKHGPEWFEVREANVSVLAQADQRGVLEDRPVVPSATRDRTAA